MRLDALEVFDRFWSKHNVEGHSGQIIAKISVSSE